MKVSKIRELGSRFFLLLGLCACTARPVSFVPPAPAGQIRPLVTPLPVSPPGGAPTPAREVFRPTATPACADDLTYLEDLSIPDGTLVEPGQALDKRWQVENSGDCNWDERYRLRKVDGEALGAQAEYALYPARSGAQAVVRIVFTAPSQPGSYRSAWQAFDPQGEPFGDPIFIQVVVQ